MTRKGNQILLLGAGPLPGPATSLKQDFCKTMILSQPTKHIPSQAFHHAVPTPNRNWLGTMVSSYAPRLAAPKDQTR